MERNSQYLVEKYPDLAGSKPVEAAVTKSIASGEKGPNTRVDRVERYLARLEAITKKKDGQTPAERGALFAYDRTEEVDETPDHTAQQHAQHPERTAEYLKDRILKEYCLDTTDKVTVEAVIRSLYESEKQTARDNGHGAQVRQLETLRPQDIYTKYHDLVLKKAKKQQESLSDWLDYLNQNQAFYPMWFQYFVVRELKKMGNIDTDHFTYTRRSKNTAVPFPDLDPEALAWVFKRITNKDGESIPSDWYVPRDETVATHRDVLVRALDKKDFASLYAIATLETAGEANKETIDGEWRTYKQGSDPSILEADLRNKKTSWCTAEGSAPGYLQRGDAYVYYTKTESGYTQPRLAIHMSNGEVSDVQGIQGGKKQEIEPVLLDIAKAKYESLPGGDKFAKKGRDMKQMTSIYSQYDPETKQWKRPLTKDELVFLYEIEDKIVGFDQFGGKDERVDELRATRKDASLLEADMLTIFDCEPNQIAFSKEQIIKNKEQNIETKAYVGSLYPNIFIDLEDVEHIYISFPERRVRKEQITHGNKTAGQLVVDMAQLGFRFCGLAKKMMYHKDFTIPKQEIKTEFVRLTVRDLFGDANTHTTEQIWNKAKELGLGLCPLDFGPHYRLRYVDQPMDERLVIAMDPVIVEHVPFIFGLHCNANNLDLISFVGAPQFNWDSDREFVFTIRSSFSK